jgi:hypothetical protein
MRNVLMKHISESEEGSSMFVFELMERDYEPSRPSASMGGLWGPRKRSFVTRFWPLCARIQVKLRAFREERLGGSTRCRI